jgi:hypothetical protein
MFEILGYATTIIYLFSLYPIYKILDNNTKFERIALTIFWPFVGLIILLVAFFIDDIEKCEVIE